MNTPPPLPNHSPANSFFHKAATVSLFAVPLSIAVNMVSGAGTAQFDPEMRRLVILVVGILAGVIMLLGLVAGVVALCGIPKYGKKGILWKALVGTVLPLFLVVLAIPAVMGATERARQLRERKGSVDEQLSALAANLNSKTPITIDAYTSLLSASNLPNKTIQYHYSTPTKIASDFPQGALKEALLPGLLKKYQTSPDMAVFRDNKVTIVYRYTDREGQLIDQFTIDPSMRQSQ